MTMRAPGTSATPSGNVTRKSFVSLPFDSISSAITTFCPDFRWPSEAVKQTSLVPPSADCAAGFLTQYRVQGEAITGSCCWPFCAASSGAPGSACPAFGPGAPCDGGAGGFVDRCWASAPSPAVRASAAIASLLSARAFCAPDAVRCFMRGGPLVLPAPWRNVLDCVSVVRAVRGPRQPFDRGHSRGLLIEVLHAKKPRTGRCKTPARIAAHACSRFFLRETAIVRRLSLLVFHQGRGRPMHIAGSTPLF